MSRIQTILDNARGSLADPNKERWSDARLLSLLSRGHRHFAKESRLYVKKVALPIMLANPHYKLPADAYMLVRARGPDGRIPLISSYDLDKRDPLWQKRIGPAVLALVYDVQTPNAFRLYPIIAEQIDTAPYEINSVYGVAVDFITVDNLITNDIYGVVVGAEVYIILQYIAIPAHLATVNDELVLPTVYDETLEHFVVGSAFRDDLDTSYRQLGAEHLAMYNDGLNAAKNAHFGDSVEGEKAYSVSRKVF